MIPENRALIITEGPQPVMDEDCNETFDDEVILFILIEVEVVGHFRNGAPIFIPPADDRLVEGHDCRILWSPSPGHLAESEVGFSRTVLPRPFAHPIDWVNSRFTKPHQARNDRRRLMANAFIEVGDPYLGAFLCRELELRGVHVEEVSTDSHVPIEACFDQ